MHQLPPLNALRAFDAAGRQLNFRLAAEELGVTQAAVAQQVRLLESRLAVPLFERLPKGLAFTAAGRGYHEKVATAFEDLRAATEQLQPQPQSCGFGGHPDRHSDKIRTRVPISSGQGFRGIRTGSLTP